MMGGEGDIQDSDLDYHGSSKGHPVYACVAFGLVFALMGSIIGIGAYNEIQGNGRHPVEISTQRYPTRADREFFEKRAKISKKRKSRLAQQKPSQLENKLFTFPESKEEVPEGNSLFYER